MPVTVENVLAALASRSIWVDYGRKKDKTPTNWRYAGIMQTLESDLHDLRREERKREREGKVRDGSMLASEVKDGIDVLTKRRPIATATGTQTRSRKTEAPFSDVVADALVDMPAIYLNCILWIVDGDRSSYKALHKRLLKFGMSTRRKDSSWPEKLSRNNCGCWRAAADDYLEDLVTLALLELRTPEVLSTHDLRSEWFGISSSHWRRLLISPYGVVQGKTVEWFGSSCAHIGRRLKARRES